MTNRGSPPSELPAGWRVVRRSGRPTYRRADGVEVKLDAPGRWGVRMPKAWGDFPVPFNSFEDQVYAMEWANHIFPQEGSQK